MKRPGSKESRARVVLKNRSFPPSNPAFTFLIVDGLRYTPPFQRKHYRRLFTRLLHSPSLLHPPPPKESVRLGSIPPSALSSFPCYASYGLKKLGLLSGSNEGVVMEEARRLEERYVGWEWDVKGRVLETLVKLLGGLIESFVFLSLFLSFILYFLAC